LLFLSALKKNGFKARQGEIFMSDFVSDFVSLLYSLKILDDQWLCLSLSLSTLKMFAAIYIFSPLLSPFLLSLSLSLSLPPPLQQTLLLLLSLFFFLVKVVKKRLRTQPLPR